MGIGFLLQADTLSNFLFLWLSASFRFGEVEHLIKQLEAALSKYVSPENLYMTFSDYHIYQYDGEIPWHVKLKANNYIFHNYNEGDIALLGLNIFINGKQIDSIINLIRQFGIRKLPKKLVI